MNLYQLFKHKFFGCHYIMYRDSATSFVAQVKRMPNGELMMLGGFCRGHYNATLNPNETFRNRCGKWEALTWKHQFKQECSNG